MELIVDEEGYWLIVELSQALALSGASTKSEQELLDKADEWLEKSEFGEDRG
jgi:hypothetical protein